MGSHLEIKENGTDNSEKDQNIIGGFPNIFLALTPLHLLVSIGFSKIKQFEHNILILREDFAKFDVYFDIINEWNKESHLFTRIIRIKGSYGRIAKDPISNVKFNRKRMKDFIKLYKNLVAIKSPVINDGIDIGKNQVRTEYSENLKKSKASFFIFNNDTIEGQYLLSRIKKDQIEVNYLDDGIASYITVKQNTKSVKYVISQLQKSIIHKILIGPWYKTVRIYGLDKRIKNIYSFKPDLVLKELKQRKIEKIPSNVFNFLNEMGIIDLLVEKLFDNMEIIRELNTIEQSEIIIFFLMPLAESVAPYGLDIPQLNEKIDELLSVVVNQNTRIYFKYHPREKELYYKGIYQNKALNLPNSVIWEIFSIYLTKVIEKNNLKKGKIFLLGPYSTSLFTARIILGDSIEIFSYNNLITEINIENLSSLKRMNIFILENMDEFKDLFKRKY